MGQGHGVVQLHLLQALRFRTFGWIERDIALVTSPPLAGGYLRSPAYEVSGILDRHPERYYSLGELGLLDAEDVGSAGRSVRSSIHRARRNLLKAEEIQAGQAVVRVFQWRGDDNFKITSGIRLVPNPVDVKMFREWSERATDYHPHTIENWMVEEAKGRSRILRSWAETERDRWWPMAPGRCVRGSDGKLLNPDWRASARPRARWPWPTPDQLHRWGEWGGVSIIQQKAPPPRRN